MQDLEQTLGSKRDLENRFHYHIEQDVISESSFTVTQLEDIFLGFPIESIQDDAELLAEIKDNLSINNGSNIVT